MIEDLLNHRGDFIHLLHIGIQLGVDDVQGDEACLAIVDVDFQFLPQQLRDFSSPAGIPLYTATLTLSSSVGSKTIPIFDPFDHVGDVVGQRDVDGIVDPFGGLRLDIIDDFFRNQNRFVRRPERASLNFWPTSS